MYWNLTELCSNDSKTLVCDRPNLKNEGWERRGISLYEPKYNTLTFLHSINSLAVLKDSN